MNIDNNAPIGSLALPDYSGTWTAIITPFKEDETLDETAFRKLIHRQIQNGVTGIVPVGTTGESPTTTADEDYRIFKIATEEASGEIRVMVGTGSNCTKDAIKYTENAKKAGADCCLVVSPYYNKPTQSGMLAHYKAIADVGLPVIVYNIKGRTSINIETDTLMEMAKHEMIVGVKEASGDLEQMEAVIENRPNQFSILSGDDGLTLSLIKMGGHGVVSVSSNVAPDQVSKMVNYALNGNFEEAEKLNDHLENMFKDLFVETNPIPVKYVLSQMGLCSPTFRLPLCTPSADAKKILDKLIIRYQLNE